MSKRYLRNLSFGKKNKKHFLVLDVGTTGVKAFVFDRKLSVVSRAYKPLHKNFPKRDWVEQDPRELLLVSRNALREAVKISKAKSDSFIGLGITNQRETTILWNKKTGKPVYPAIVWEDTRTKKFCARLRRKFEGTAREKTGLSIDPYFSAAKIAWIFKNVQAARKLAKSRELAFGTVDTWILWNFLDNNPHLTDYTNASRTLLFNIRKLSWDNELLEIFGVPKGILPQVKPSQAYFGTIKKELLGFSLPLLAVCGDQQASLYAAGNKPRTTKVTFGTGTFIMQVLGPKFSLYRRFFTTLIPNTKEPFYAVEVKIACCGKKVERLLDEPILLQVLLKRLAKWVDSRLQELPLKPGELVIDGGVTKDKRLALVQNEISNLPVRRQKIFDGTALGIAKMLKMQ